MAEEEVQYSSVIFKTKKQLRPEAIEEEKTVYGEVKVRDEATEQRETNATKEEETVYTEVRVCNKTPEQTPDTTVGPNKEAEGRHRCCLKLAYCFGILCVILLFGVIGVWVYFALILQSDVGELNHLKANQSALQAQNLNLTYLNSNLSSDIKIVKKDLDNLTMWFDNVTQALTVSENKIRNLTGENQKLTKQNEELETKTRNLTDKITNMTETWNKDNISQSQWSIDKFCPKEKEVRTCKPCRKGWLPFQSSCYAYNDAEPPNQKTWEEAREDCRGKISDLTAVADETEKTYVSSISSTDAGKQITGYWIGLKAVEGKWRWINGSDLTNKTWVNQTANENQCVISVKTNQWTSVSCEDRNGWICENKALSV